MTLRRSSALAAAILASLLATACSDSPGGLTTPPTERSLDQQVRASISGWGVVPILPINAQAPGACRPGPITVL
jgi:hypothetical protein